MKIILISVFPPYRGGISAHSFALYKNLVNNNKEYFPSFIDYNELNDTKSISNGMKVLKRSVYSFEVKK